MHPIDFERDGCDVDAPVLPAPMEEARPSALALFPFVAALSPSRPGLGESHPLRYLQEAWWRSGPRLPR